MITDTTIKGFRLSPHQKRLWFLQQDSFADVISEINQVYQQSKTSFPWQQQDILMLDNMLAAHGRYPYIGERKIVVAMAEMIQSKDIVIHGKAGGGK